MGRRSTGAGCLSGTMLLVLATAVVLALFLLQRVGSPLDVFRQPETTTERLGPAIIDQIKAVNKLETQSYVLDGVYRVGQEGDSAASFLYKDVIVLAARAEIIAGIDLTKLREQDVKVIDSTVAITLPASEILVFRMDERGTRVYDREQGWLVGLGLVGSDPNLETMARRYAEQRLLEDACEKKILEAAAEEGRRVMERMLYALEFTHVIVVAPAGSCTEQASTLAPSPVATPALSGTATPQLALPPPVETPQDTAEVTPTSGGWGLTGTVVVVETPTP